REAMLVSTPLATLMAVDASMGIEGTPQSATGQASLLTGKNVPAWLGEHEGPKPTPPIIELLARGTIFTQLGQRGRSVALVNAFPPRYFSAIERGYRLPGVIALSAQQAGLHLHTKEDLHAGRAISADFSGEGWRSHLGYPDMPELSLNEAGVRLSSLAVQHDLTVFEYWLTDVAGHHQDTQAAHAILKTLDEVLGSLVRSVDGDHTLVLVTSDHGNLEDLSSRHHTANDVPLLLIGSQKSRDGFLQGLDGRCRSKPDLADIGSALVEFIG
ncbi:MAG: alkaline phosphatase family protein, partial [Acidobacteriaceae bacterium]